MFRVSKERDKEIADLAIEKRKLLDRVKEIDRRFIELGASPDLASNIAFPKTISQRILEMLALDPGDSYDVETIAGWVNSTEPVVRTALHRLVKSKQLKRVKFGRLTQYALAKSSRGKE